jgi:hypothetical protein
MGSAEDASQAPDEAGVEHVSLDRRGEPGLLVVGNHLRIRHTEILYTIYTILYVTITMTTITMN